MADKVTVRFIGPFSWPGAPDAPSVFDVEARQERGIYLWTIPQRDGFLVYYVGETGRSSSFQDGGIRYHPRREDEEPIGCIITCPVPLIALPERLSA
jgi:hypothetical protein